MTVLTIRGIDDELDAALRTEAKAQGLSVNALVRDLLRRGLGLGEGPHGHHDLDPLAGTWSPADLESFRAATAPLEDVDPGLWE